MKRGGLHHNEQSTPITSRAMAGILMAGITLCAASAPWPSAVLPASASETTMILDELRNVKVGEMVPAFKLPGIDKTTYDSSQFKGKVLVVVYVSATQRSSERAAIDAHQLKKDLNNPSLEFIYVTTDLSKTTYYREFRDQHGIHEPLLFDSARDYYGDLGLIVLPTTIIIDKEGKLARVISSYKSDYPHVLRSYARHTLGLIDDGQLKQLLEIKDFDRTSPKSKAARHRATAQLLREKGLLQGAENELKEALKHDPENNEITIELASLYLAMKRVDDAEAQVNVVLTKDPENRHAMLLNGIILYLRGELDAAQELLDRVLILNPDPARTHYYLGLISEKKGDQEKAIYHYRQALKRLIDDPVE
ncbi:MAG: tetratricopeptide repeat protein [Planctomycetes bacterium]|nr:tetratricopeptide repeat protein [Planctomycetota bacterium]NOG53743.1 tetratricopeptide repeat protein [Planctomycetota bacterium]